MRWTYNIHQDGNQTSFHGNPLIADQLILIGTDKSCATGSIGHVYAFDRNNGAVRWKYRTAGTPSDVARIGPTVYAGDDPDELIALKLVDGRLRWKFTTGTPNPECEFPSSPVVAGQRVFYAGLDKVLYGLDGMSGRVLWKQNLGNRVTTKLTVVGRSIYLGTSANQLLRLSADDGRVEGDLAVPAPPEGRMLVDGNSLYVFLDDRESRAGYLIRTTLNLSNIQWAQKTTPDWASEWPRLWDGLLLAGNCRGQITAFRRSDGAPQWSDKLKGCLRSIGTDGNHRQIYVGAQEGTVYAYSPPSANSERSK